MVWWSHSGEEVVARLGTFFGEKVLGVRVFFFAVLTRVHEMKKGPTERVTPIEAGFAAVWLLAVTMAREVRAGCEE